MCRLRAVSPFFRFSDGSASAHERRAACRKKRGRLAPSITHMVICVSHAYCSMDQEKRETARSLHICKAKPENFCSLRFHLDNHWSCLAYNSNLNTCNLLCELYQKTIKKCTSLFELFLDCFSCGDQLYNSLTF